MSGTVELGKFQQLCLCRIKVYLDRKKKVKDRCKRKRQVFVYNPEEEIWHEPYMQTLRREFSDESILCDSKVELPWRDIALPSAGMRIRPDTTSADREAEVETDNETKTVSDEKRESTGAMKLPWKDLVITEILPSTLDGICDSTVEIPWADLALEKSVEIRPPRDQTCATDDVEIPWDEILVPSNIVIKSEKKRRHPSSIQRPRPRVDVPPTFICPSICCAKIRPKIKMKAWNPPGSNWLNTCM